MATPAQGPGRWRKSSYSGGETNGCVEIDGARVALAIRDSKDPAGGMLRLPSAAWRAVRIAVTR